MNHGKQLQTNLGPFLASSVPSLELLSLKEGWPVSGSQAGEAMVVHQIYTAESAGEGTSRRDGVKGGKAGGQPGPERFAVDPSFSCMPSPTSFGRAANGALLLLSPPPRARPLHFSQHPMCFVDLGQKDSGAAQPFITLIF